MTNTATTISVIIPVYNGSAFLAEAIESVLSQTHQAYEVIVVDDGSTDDSVAVAERYAPAVRIVSQPNAGCGAARNLGVLHAGGSLLAFLDADDLWVPDKLQQQVCALAHDDTLEMVFGRVEVFHDIEDNNALATATQVYDGIIAGTMLIIHTAFQRVGAFATEWRIGEFADWYARALECGVRAHTIPQVLMKRRLHAKNITRAAADSRTAYLQVLRNTLRRRQVFAADETAIITETTNQAE